MRKSVFFLFKVTEKVGRFIVQSCVLLHTRVCTCTILLRVCAGARAHVLIENSFLM